MNNHPAAKRRVQRAPPCQAATLGPYQLLTQIVCDIKPILGDTSCEAQQLGPWEPAKGEVCLGGVWQGRVVGSKGRAWLHGWELLKDQAARPAVAKGSTELSAGHFFSSQCSTTCTREERQCRGRGRGTSRAESQASLQP